MRVLIACEFSGVVRDAFIRRGHNAISCDLLPSIAPGPHIKGNVFDILFRACWDLVIAFPPCTDLAVSGARYFNKKRSDGRQDRSVKFFMDFLNCYCPLCIENPVGIMSRIYRKPDQIIQPWQFGDPESKKTCLWLKSLPLLIPTKILNKPISGRWKNQTPSGQNSLGPSADRAQKRSITYRGIAEAMADQWS